jgi:hypothetical protein
MIGTASGIVLGFLLATIYGAAFHLFVGGPTRRIVLYILASWVGFTIGHFVGDLLDIELLRLGAVHLFSASLGAWIALISTWLLERSRS